MKKLLSVLLAMAMLLTCVPLGTLSASAAIAGESVHNTNIRYNGNSLTDDMGLNADFVFLAKNYPEYFSNPAATVVSSNCLDCCNTVLQNYDKNDNRLLAFAESFVNGTEILIKEVGSKLGVAQSTEEEWLQKNTTEYLRLVSGCESIICDEWNNVAKKYKDFKFSIKGIDTMDTVAVAAKKSEFIKAVSERTGCLSEAEATTLANRLIKKQPNGISKFFSTVDYAVDLADVMLFSCQMLEVETSVLRRLQNHVRSDSSLYKGIQLVLDAIENDPAGWVVKKYLSDQVCDIIQGEILEKVVDWTAEQLVGGDFGIIRKAVTVTASLLYNYVYQGAKIDEIYGAIVAYDFYVTVSSPFMRQHTALLQCKRDKQEVTEQMLLDFIFLYEARRKAMLHYTEACITIAKHGYDDLLKSYQEGFADDGFLAFDNYIALCMNQLKADIDAGKVTMATIDAGTYFIKNKGTGKYLDVDGAIDARGQNIWVYAFNGHDSEKFEITPSTTTAGYKIRPLCSASRVVNAYGDTVSSGANVCLWDNVDNHTESQRWNFEAVNGGYVIRNVQAPSCVLTVQSDNNVCVQTYTGADSQIWTLESASSSQAYEYAYFPGDVLNVTQGAYGEYKSTSHNGQTGFVQNAFDFGTNENYCAPFSGTITKIKTSYNAVVLQSDNKVYWANGTLDYMSVTFVHDNDISDLYVGKHIAQGEVFYQRGEKGYSIGPHVHICVNKGQTTEGIRYFSGDTRPNEAFFLKDSVTIQQTGNYTWKKVSTPTPPPTTSYGTYYIKNNGTGLYLDVSQGQDVQLRNVLVWSFNGGDNQKFEVTESTTTAGYAMRPLSSVSRKVNVEADTVVSGKNVCIYDDTGHDSQRWNFEKVNGGYVIRNVQNPNCVLDVEDGENVYVSTYTGAATQIWTFQDVNCTHTYDNACDATCNSCGMDRSVSGHNWVEATCTAAKTCTNCGAIEGAALGHNWIDATCTTPKTCSVCGETDGASLGHDWDITTGCCAICSQRASEEYSEWLDELPADITEDLFDIERKTVYRYRDNSSHLSYGEWSAEKTTSTKPAESDTLTIVSITTYYNYYHYCCNYYNGSYNVDSIPYGSGGQYHTIRLTYELSRNNVADKGGETLYGSCTCSKGFNVWAKADQYITYEYKYKTRTATTVVDYGTWTDWSDTAPSAASNRDIESKTLYRYKLKHVHTWVDATCTEPKSCSVCGVTDGEANGHAYDHSCDTDCNVCGAVREISIVPGDANGDGKTNNRDLALLQQYLSEWDVTIDTEVMDVNDDGRVNNRDLALLQQYLSEWDVELK